MQLILASGSPRRSALLKQVGIAHQVIPADIDESPHPHETAASACRRFAQEKAATIATRFPTALILAADTIGIMDGALLGKPKNIDDARTMLHAMAGRAHTVLTAFTLQHGNEIISDAVEATVWMCAYDSALIEAYLASGEPLDKAGAYGIQGAGALLVEKIIGDFYAVVGLPIAPVCTALRHFGLMPLQNLPQE